MVWINNQINYLIDCSDCIKINWLSNNNVEMKSCWNEKLLKRKVVEKKVNAKEKFENKIESFLNYKFFINSLILQIIVIIKDFVKDYEIILEIFAIFYSNHTKKANHSFIIIFHNHIV